MLSLQAILSKLIGQPESEVPVPEARNFSPEVWVKERKAFIFQCENRRFGDKATFCVTQLALQDLEPQLRFEPSAAFEALRPVIYGAALECMREASPMIQHVLTSHQLRAVQQEVLSPGAARRWPS